MTPHLHGEGVGVVEGKSDVLQVVGEGHLLGNKVVDLEAVATLVLVEQVGNFPGAGFPG